jgi:peptide/nickel transport system permease protein
MMRKNKAQPAGTSQTPGTADAAQGMNVVARTQAQLVRRRFFRHKGALAGMMLFGFIVLLATFSIGWGPLPGLWDKDPTSVNTPSARTTSAGTTSRWSCAAPRCR